MYRNPELLLNGLDTGDRRQGWLGSSQGSHMLEDLGGQLVPLLGPALFRKQTAQATLLKSCLSLV
jgi:hypothetical protein